MMGSHDWRSRIWGVSKSSSQRDSRRRIDLPLSLKALLKRLPLVVAVLAFLPWGCGVPEDPGQLKVVADRIFIDGISSLTFYVDRIDIVWSETLDGPETIVTLTEEDLVVETVGAPALKPTEVVTAFVEPGYVKQVRLIITHAEAVLSTGEFVQPHLPSQPQTGEKVVAGDVVVEIKDGLTTAVTIRIDPEKTVTFPPGQDILVKPTIGILLGEVTSFPVNEFVPGELILWFNEGTPIEDINQAIADIGAIAVSADEEILMYHLHLPEGMTEAEGRDAFQATGLVDAYTLNWIGILHYVPSDDGYSPGASFYLNRIRATGPGTTALDIEQGSSDVTVAVLDMGMALEDVGPPFDPYDDFEWTSTGSKLWLNSGEDLDASGQKPGDGVLTAADFNGVDDDGNDIVDDLNGAHLFVIPGLVKQYNTNMFYSDLTWHGTAVASMIGAELDNDPSPFSGDVGVEMIGVSPGCTIMPIKCFYNEHFSIMNYFDALRYAKKKGAHITNSSLGAAIDLSLENLPGWLYLFGDVVNNWKRGWDRCDVGDMLHTVSAGNDGINLVDNADDTFVFPAEMKRPNIITVGGTMYNPGTGEEERYVDPVYASNFSKTAVHVGAPWGGTVALYEDGQVYGFGGTSAAAPQVAGVAALLMSQRPALKGDPVLTREIILTNVTKSPMLNNIFETGGTVNALKCVSGPLVDIQTLPVTPVAGSPVQFIGSSSTDPDGNNIISYEWSFGDGATESGVFANVDTTHTYSAPGTYEVKLKLTDDLAPEPATGIARVLVQVGP